MRQLEENAKFQKMIEDALADNPALLSTILANKPVPNQATQATIEAERARQAAITNKQTTTTK